MKHELVRFEECSLFNSEHSYADGYSRAICSCGWRSAAMREKNLPSLFAVHAQREDVKEATRAPADGGKP